VVHEYYDAETGAPLFNPGFLSWNLLARRILDDLEAGIDPTEIGPFAGSLCPPGSPTEE
jgi:hypothetical protein